MKPVLTAILILMPGLVMAHPGHLTDVSGHDHWVAGIAIGVAIGVALWGLIKGNRAKDEDADDATETADAEPQNG